MKKAEGRRMKDETVGPPITSARGGKKRPQPDGNCQLDGTGWLRDVCDAVTMAWFLAL